MRHLHVGGVVAIGFDPTEEFILVISHSGRGVFSTQSWERVARDYELAYPENGLGTGIGPLEGLRIQMTEKDYSTDELSLYNSNGSILLKYSEGTVAVFEAVDPKPRTSLRHRPPITGVPQAGEYQGRLVVPDDLDEPLEELREHMEEPHAGA